VASDGWKGAREKGVVRSEGKDYVVRDGDVMLFRFNVSASAVGRRRDSSTARGQRLGRCRIFPIQRVNRPTESGPNRIKWGVEPISRR
jgi:hypothetical protein